MRKTRDQLQKRGYIAAMNADSASTDVNFVTPDKSVARDALAVAFDALLQPQLFKDYGPNGLQVEGRTEVRKIVSGVTASQALIDAAIAEDADAIFVHHGLFWRGYEGRVTGWMRKRLGALIEANVSLFAYHLPLDAHPTLGNNAQLAKQLGFVPFEGAAGRFGEQNLGFLGHWPAHPNGCTNQDLAEVISSDLHRPSVQLFRQGPIRKIAWCTGGAQGYFEAAIAAGADAFITGEISEPQTHYAREANVAYFACGHHATERYGAPAVAEHVAAQFGIAHRFIDIDNPA
jgi:dinuclear metal center YbgI/SA1388 family protein